MLERLEANRVLHLATVQREYARAAWCAESSARKDALLRKLVQSGTFALAVALSRLRQRGEPAFSKDEIRASAAGVRALASARCGRRGARAGRLRQ